MPRISSFYGIVISMYHDESHLPAPASWYSSGAWRTATSCGKIGVEPANTSRCRRSTPYHELMRGTPRLLEAKPNGSYAVHVRFEDGTDAQVDLSYLREYGGVFEPLRDADFFAQLRVDDEGATIIWPNEADIAPETLYAHARRHAGATA